MDKSTISRTIDQINKIFEKNKFVFSKKKNNIINVKDNIITYKIFPKQLTCQCMNNKNLCDHLLFALAYYYNLSAFVITFITMNDIKSKFSTYLNNNINFIELDSKLSDDIMKMLRNNECGICLDSLAEYKYKQELYQCDKCYNMVHFKCMTKWKSFKKKNEPKKGCVYCMTISVNSLGF